MKNILIILHNNIIGKINNHLHWFNSNVRTTFQKFVVEFPSWGTKIVVFSH